MQPDTDLTVNNCCSMENSVLGNALEGVPEEEEDDEGKPKDSTVDSTENIDGRKTIFVKYYKAF